MSAQAQAAPRPPKPLVPPMLRYLLPFASALLLTASAQAQGLCFGPDLLNGPCCAPTGVNLPPLPPINMQAAAICWTGCALSGQDCAQLSSSPPSPTAVCGQFNLSLTVSDCTSTPHMIGFGLMDYARTWREQGNTVNTAGTVVPTVYQVWRFMLKLDLFRVVPSSPAPACMVPNDLGLNPTVFYYGYVDYALDCSSGTIQNSLMLFHGSDWLINFPGISGNLSGANPLRSHALVGPDTGLTPFVAADFLIAPANPQFDSIRPIGNVNLPGTPAACNTEETLTAAVYNPYGFGCLNPPSLGPIQSAAVLLNGGSACGSGFQTLNLFGTVPWLDMISTSIGSWTLNNNYPGPERVRANEGLFLYRDSCQFGTVGWQAFEVFYGAETRGGFTALLPIASGPGPIVANFLDMCSNWRNPAGTPLILPAIGRVMNSYHILSINP
jgi:hypothetical protein